MSLSQLARAFSSSKIIIIDYDSINQEMIDLLFMIEKNIINRW